MISTCRERIYPFRFHMKRLLITERINAFPTFSQNYPVTRSNHTPNGILYTYTIHTPDILLPPRIFFHLKKLTNPSNCVTMN